MISIPVVLCLAIATVGQAPQPLPLDQISQAVRELGDNSFSARQEAMERLWATGEPAREAVEGAAESEDRETAQRARSILERFNYGLYIDTPEDRVRRINQFRFGNKQAKKVVFERLESKGDVETIVLLLRAEPSAATRAELHKHLLYRINRLAHRFAELGKLDQAELLIDELATSELAWRHRAVYFAWTGQLSERTKQLAAKLAEGSIPEGAKRADAARQLVFYQRMLGDLAAAAATASKHELHDMEREVLYESGDWSAVAKAFRAQVERTDGGDIEALGFLAAAERSAGQMDQFVLTLEQIRRKAKDNKELRWHATEILLINDRVKEGIEILKTAQPPNAFRLMTRQGDYTAAFEFAGLKPDASDHEKWFADPLLKAPKKMKTPEAEKIKRQKEDNTPGRQERFELAVEVARAFQLLGERDLATQYFEQLTEFANATDDRYRKRLQLVVKTCFQAGMLDQALEFAAPAMQDTYGKQMLQVLYPNDTKHVSLLWDFTSSTEPKSKLHDRLLRLERILRPKRGKAFSEAEFRAIIERMMDLSKRNSPQRARWLIALAAVAKRHDHKGLTAEIIEPVSQVDAAAALLMADNHREADRFAEAAAMYARAVELDPNSAIARFLEGYSLSKAGHTEEGERKQKLALLYPLANDTMRHQLAGALNERKLKEEALGQFNWLLRSGDFRSWHINDANKDIGNALPEEQSDEKAQHWNRLLFSALTKRANFTRVRSYLQLSTLIHKAQARNHLQKGEF
ncbi:MAG: hypothetical protein QF805_10195, partial [Pirellulaceae bacterium]|nr:hypothetical protein [Pirellulaceae bacterium]